MVALTPLIGRTLELQQVRSLLSEGARLVTLHGPGGIGKTRLAQEVRASLAPAVFCELADARTFADACGCIRVALGRTGDGATAEALGRELATRGPLLLVLDNFEHLVDAGASHVARWLEQAPALKLLVTSQERLRLSAEHLVPIGPMTLEESGEAQTLFLARYRQLHPHYLPSPEERRAITELVTRLEGIPLAIELVAARGAVLTPAQMLALDEGLEAEGPRDAPARHRSVRAAVAGSWNLLDADERIALAQCTAFRGGFDADAAREVIALPTGGADCLDVLQRIEAKSLLVRSTGLTGHRFRMLSLVERHVRALASPSLLEAARRRHLVWALREGTRWAERSRSRDASMWFARMDAELPNLLTAYETLKQSPETAPAAWRSLVLALEPALANSGQLEQLLEVTDDALKRTGFEAARIHATRALALRRLGRANDALAALGDALHAARTAEDVAEEGHLLLERGVLLWRTGRLKDAEADLEGALTLLRAQQDAVGEARALLQLGLLARTRGDTRSARERQQEASEVAARTDDGWTRGAVVCLLAGVDQDEGRFEAAERGHRRALQIHQQHGARRSEAVALMDLAGLAFERGDRDAALGHYREALDLLRMGLDRGLFGLAASTLGAVLCHLGHAEEATRCFAEVEVVIEDLDDDLAVAARLNLGHRALLSRSETERATALRAAFEQLEGCEREGPHGLPRERSDEVRLAARMLARAIASLPEATSTLRVSRDGARFIAPGSTQEVDLSRHAGPRSLLEALVRRRLRVPGAGLAVGELIEAGWPDQRLLPQSAQNRLNVALATLRKRGLRDVLLYVGGRYRLDEQVPVLVDATDAQPRSRR
jgi:predicted ATPase